MLAVVSPQGPIAVLAAGAPPSQETLKIPTMFTNQGQSAGLKQ
tara:strand:- start:243 stop:371 length:129 start_codon:yes stop_codon:yes gene_type:complete